MKRRVLGVAAIALAVAILVLPVRSWLVQLAAWAREAGAGGALLYVCAYLAATLLFIPGALLTVGAGFAYGPLRGAALIWPAAMVSSTSAFLLGRTLARDWVARHIARSPRFAALDAAVGENGFRTVLLLRLSPLFPFAFVNYGLGLSRMRLRDFALGTALGILPTTAAYVYAGSAITGAAELASGQVRGGPGHYVLLGVGLLSTFAVAAFSTRAARRALGQLLPPETPTQ